MTLIETRQAHPTLTNPIEWIEAKKQGLEHSPQAIADLVTAVMEGRMCDYQLSAWLMAVCLKGLSLEETVALTDAFVRSGHQLCWKQLGSPTVDKHSTGGVGDKTTLIVLALLGAVGVKAPKLSGRGLGYTGGTIDKIEAIPGFQSALSDEAFQSQLESIGIALSSQTPNLAPADGVFYALRDVTATVDNLSLIAASVVSKKIASGADAIVLDIKVGNGAFMKTLPEAQALATLCTAIGERFNRRIETIISNMDAPLGQAIGHSLEIIEVIETLKGKGPADLQAVSLELAATGMVAAGVSESLEAALLQLQEALDSGKALAALKSLIQAQGGDVAVLEHYDLLPQATRMVVVPSPQSGYVVGMNALALAKVVKALGGGRSKKEDVLDLGVGLVLKRTLGDAVQAGESIAIVHANKCLVDDIIQQVQAAFTFAEAPVEPPALVLHHSLRV